MAIEARADAAEAAALASAGPPPSPARAALAPPRRAGASVVHIKGSWFIVARSRELRRKPLATLLFGTPIVLFRDASGRAGALLDRCPHRNVPLSLGRVAGDGTLQCPYHGWRFDTEGACTFVPSLTDGSEAKARRAHRFPTVE
jgi:phenylpropionate dioxygenase-like ring-hydroxylating dioxygenase large terminal subunit